MGARAGREDFWGEAPDSFGDVFGAESGEGGEGGHGDASGGDEMR